MTMSGRVRRSVHAQTSEGRATLVMLKCACGTFRVELLDSVSSYFFQNVESCRVCFTCRKLFKMDEVRGALNPKVKCDGRCTHAKGFNCECACGGKNHGKES